MITSAQFIKGIVGEDELLDDGTPQVAIIGRSNVGKSSIINAFTGEKGLARESATPGRTREINVFLINKKLYLIDLPGYGFSKGAWEDRNVIKDLIYWYLIKSHYIQKHIIIVIDAVVGPTDYDRDLLADLEERGKNIVIVANKIDKLTQAEYSKQFKMIAEFAGTHDVIPFSAKKKLGVRELSKKILN